MISVEVVAAWPDSTIRVVVEVPEQSTLAEAVALASTQSEALADRLKHVPGDGGFAWGIYGQQLEPESVLKAGARVELYRPLQRDPREARRLLASQGLDVTHAD